MATVSALAQVALTVGERDRDAAWNPTLFHRLGEIGMFGLSDGPTLAAALRALGAAGDAGLALAWVSHAVGACLPVARLGAPGHAELLDALVAGRRVGALAHAEAPAPEDGAVGAGAVAPPREDGAVAAAREGGVVGAGAAAPARHDGAAAPARHDGAAAPARHDGAAAPVRGDGAVGVRTRAIRDGDRWILDGRKVAVVNGGVADVLVVTAATGPHPDDVTAFLVPGYAPGVRVTRRDTPGLRTAVVGDVELRSCVVPWSARLGDEGEALREVVAPALRWGRACRYAAWVGLLRALLDDTVARVRAPAGRALAADQEVRAALADARIRVELLDRILARSASRVAEVGSAAERDVAVGALFAADAVADVVGVLARVQGAAALEAGALAERMRRDADTFAALTEPREALRSAVADALLPR